MDLPEAKAVMSQFQASFPRPVLEPLAVSVWREELLPYELADAQAAVRALHRTEKWQPSMAELLEEVRAQRDSRIARENATRPALPAEATLTDEQRARADEAKAASFRRWRERRAQREAEGARAQEDPRSAREPVDCPECGEVLEGNERLTHSCRERMDAEARALGEAIR